MALLMDSGDKQMFDSRAIDKDEASRIPEAGRIGLEYGSVLGRRREGLEMMETQLRAVWQEALHEATARRDLLESQLKNLEGLTEQAAKAVKVATDEQQRLEQLRRDQPSDFAMVKGILYLVLSVLLVAADVSILGQVLARLLDYDWRIPGVSYTFGTLFFKAPLQAFQEFPDLFCLTLSVLVIGLFIKVWLDTLEIRLKEGRGANRFLKVKTYLFTLFFLFSVVTVISLASARLIIPIGTIPGVYPQVVAFILGLSLPFVSAGFFVRGYEVVSLRWELWQTTRKSKRLQSRRRRYQKKLEGLRETLLSVNSAAQGLEQEEHRQEVLAALRAAFSSGYQEGVKRLLQPDPASSLADKFRPIAVSRLVR